MSLYAESLRAFLKPVLNYLDDDSVTEIMINGPEDVWIERKGRLFRTEARFSEEGLLGAARNVAQFVGRPLSDERPRLDARLPDGSRIHVVLPPVARKGTTISIRKFFKDRLTIDGLLRFGSMTREMARLVEAIILSKLNIIVSGGTGSGKTTMLNVLSAFIPDEERILTIEDSAELQLNQSHLVSFESRPPDKFGKGAVDMGDLLHSSLRLRPDRIIVGEVRGGEAFHLMQALNTGHAGSLSTVHANSPTDSLRRLESLCLMSGVEMPLVAVRAQVASAIHVIICCDRLADGARKVTHISEVLPLSDRGDYRTQHIWVYSALGKDERGRSIGFHAPTGIVPQFVHRLRAQGFTDLDDRFFDPATHGVPPPPAHQVSEDFVQRWVPSLRHREKGQADPEALRQQMAAYERKLRDEARLRDDDGLDEESGPTQSHAIVPVSSAAKTLPPVPVRPPPTLAPSSPRPAAKPQPAPPGRPAASARPPVGLDADKTPPPTRNPLAASGTAPSMDVDDEDPQSVEVSAEYLQEAVSKEPTDRKPLPTGRPPASPARGVPPGRRPGAVEEDITNVKPVPEKPRR
ncbi:MAG TPA: ATPase, T2SS/T4P/T4SS family [Myxococcaceae bacterium]|nr:ATPase, T2SS/T4P/T4SS family [Myxococcaceae bacterium]